ncbi:MAG TPA: DUF1800 family protein [Planctomycetota bacterium]|nr:DUF1800 family protein [Planctomycetota bacterium]
MKDPLAPFEPSTRDPFDLAKVGHLLRRAGFSASLRTRRELAAAGLDAAMRWVLPARDRADPAADLLQEAIAFGDVGRVRAFRVWSALQGEEPLRDRLSYFWHGHFATSNRKVADARAMALQMATFDRCGSGSFDELAQAMCRDPALLRWLDNDVNTKAQPNENFARELFELFLLGRGNYTEADVRQAARCFTGWHVRDGQFQFHAHLHDAGDKQLFSASGALDGGQVVELAVARRESAEFLAAKWLRFFVQPEPEPASIDALAGVYERAGRNVGATIETLLRSRLFFAASSQRSKVKSPADFVIGTVRSLGARAAPTELASTMAALGETWLEPPSVEGWHGERAWLSPASWLLRSNFVADLLAHRRGKLRPAPHSLFDGLEKPAERARAAALLLLDGVVGAGALAALADVARAHEGDDPAAAAAVLHAAASLPEYQLS